MVSAPSYPGYKLSRDGQFPSRVRRMSKGRFFTFSWEYDFRCRNDIIEFAE